MPERMSVPPVFSFTRLAEPVRAEEMVRLPAPIMSTTVLFCRLTVPMVSLWLFALDCWMKATLPAVGPEKVRVSPCVLPMLKEALPASKRMALMTRLASRSTVV